MAELAGVCTSGVCTCGVDFSVGTGDVAGIGIPGVWTCGVVLCGDADGVAELAGNCSAGVCTCGVALSWDVELVAEGFVAGRRRLTMDFRREVVLRFTLAFAFVFGLLIPGMVWPSCWNAISAACPGRNRMAVRTNKNSFLRSEDLLLTMIVFLVRRADASPGSPKERPHSVNA